MCLQELQTSMLLREFLKKKVPDTKSATKIDKSDDIKFSVYVTFAGKKKKFEVSKSDTFSHFKKYIINEFRIKQADAK